MNILQENNVTVHSLIELSDVVGKNSRSVKEIPILESETLQESYIEKLISRPLFCEDKSGNSEKHQSRDLSSFESEENEENLKENLNGSSDSLPISLSSSSSHLPLFRSENEESQIQQIVNSNLPLVPIKNKSSPRIVTTHNPSPLLQSNLLPPPPPLPKKPSVGSSPIPSPNKKPLLPKRPLSKSYANLDDSLSSSNPSLTLTLSTSNSLHSSQILNSTLSQPSSHQFSPSHNQPSPSENQSEDQSDNQSPSHNQSSPSEIQSEDQSFAPPINLEHSSQEDSDETPPPSPPGKRVDLSTSSDYLRKGTAIKKPLPQKSSIRDVFNSSSDNESDALRRSFNKPLPKKSLTHSVKDIDNSDQNEQPINNNNFLSSSTDSITVVKKIPPKKVMLKKLLVKRMPPQKKIIKNQN